MTLASKHKSYQSFNPLNAVDLAAQNIAPSWPLDQSIAVNPWWQLRQTHMMDTAAKLGFLGNIRLLMPKSYYQALWQNELTEQHLNAAKACLNITEDTETLLAYLDKPDVSQHWVHMSDFLDHQASHQHNISWREEILQQVSHFCAFYLQFPQHFAQDLTKDEGFYQAWKTSTVADKGMQLLTGEAHLHALFSGLPDRIDDLVHDHFTALTDGNIDEAAWNDYVYALVLDINGWASCLAYDEWQAKLYGRDHRQLLRQLVAIRMAWDWVLWQNTKMRDADLFKKLSQLFMRQLYNANGLQSQRKKENRLLWVWHKATEIRFQAGMHDKLSTAIRQAVKKPVLQAVFCIDVRSALLRTQLEAQHPAIETYGFAGFFGLPIAYTSKATPYVRPQLPGLLKPTLFAQQAVAAVKVKQTQSKLQKKISWKVASETAVSTFGIVESQGLLKLFDLLKQTIFGSGPSTMSSAKEVGDAWQINSDIETLDIEALAGLAKAVLVGIGLKQPYAERVLIVGHGSFSSNNPHASGLDCGACGGQTGEVNALVLCDLLNRQALRSVLKQAGIVIPENTVFVPCLHNTVTDEIMILNNQHGAWKHWLDAATFACQQQKIAAEGLVLRERQSIQHLLKQKCKDWAQLRPEWGLVNNAAFVIAPRAETRGIDFEGRSFLHDYVWQTDSDFQLLEQIMTAPMIVTNWINLQYYASVTDHFHYGSGNKMLHNVVGGHFGVFEGNGGDLRIGLPQQSLHDGTKWRHNPVRLNVYIAAPKDAIGHIIQKHRMVKDLIENEWLFLFQWDVKTRTIWAYQQGVWQRVEQLVDDSANPMRDSDRLDQKKQIAINSADVEIARKTIVINGAHIVVDDYTSLNMKSNAGGGSRAH